MKEMTYAQFEKFLLKDVDLEAEAHAQGITLYDAIMTMEEARDAMIAEDLDWWFSDRTTEFYTEQISEDLNSWNTKVHFSIGDYSEYAYITGIYSQGITTEHPFKWTARLIEAINNLKEIYKKEIKDYLDDFEDYNRPDLEDADLELEIEEREFTVYLNGSPFYWGRISDDTTDVGYAIREMNKGLLESINRDYEYETSEERAFEWAQDKNILIREDK